MPRPDVDLLPSSDFKLRMASEQAQQLATQVTPPKIPGDVPGESLDEGGG